MPCHDFIGIGNNKIHATAVVGDVGFGFAKDDDLNFIYPLQRNIHDYNIVINDNVEIGPLTTVDRGSWRDTVIHEGVKIDSNVKIAHNVIIHKDCLIVAGVVVGGSCEIGERCFLGMNCCIKQHTKIANDVVIGAGAVVVEDITEPNTTWVGCPARKLVKGYSE